MSTLASLTVILGDRSGSMNNYGNFSNLKSCILERVTQGVTDARRGQAGRLVLVAFDHECRVVLDKRYVDIDEADRAALDDWFRPRGTTALYDGVIKALECLARYEAEHKIVVIVTDGLENASTLPDAQHRAQLAVKRAKTSGVQVFLVGDEDCLREQSGDLGLRNPGRSISLSATGTASLKRVVTAATRGGKALFTPEERVGALRRSHTFPGSNVAVS